MGLFNYSSKLSDEQLRRISLSAQYQGQQGGDHFTLSSKIGSRAKVLLEQGWGITNRQELCDTIEELLGRCRSLDIAVIKEEMMAEVQEDSGINTEVRRIWSMANIVDKHYITRAGDLSDLLNMLTNYIAAQDSLLANELITSWDAITEKDVIGWDIGRAAYLVRVGVEMKYLNSDEAWDYLEKAYQRAIRTFDTWEELGHSYIIGRCCWTSHPEERDVLGFCNVVKWLLKHPESPWVKVKLK